MITQLLKDISIIKYVLTTWFFSYIFFNPCITYFQKALILGVSTIVIIVIEFGCKVALGVNLYNHQTKEETTGNIH